MFRAASVLLTLVACALCTALAKEPDYGAGIVNSLDLQFLIQYLTPPPGPNLTNCP